MNPETLFPPSPDKIIAGIQVLADAGIALGTMFARETINFVITVFRFIV